jgi:glycosyltransferase involved in cell wall biosynthesis
MHKILFVLPSLEYGGPAKEVSLLAAGLPRDRFDMRVCAPGGEGPAAGPWRAAGLAVDTLGPARLASLAALWHFRRLVRTYRPEVIHTWGRAALRTAVLAGGRGGVRILARAPLASPKGAGPCGRWDRWLLRRVDHLLARGPAEADAYRRCGALADKVVLVPPGVAAPAPGREPGPSPLGPSRFLACAGPLEPHKGFRDAIWSFDILQYLYADLWLVVLGTGSDRDRLERFAAATGAGKRVRFAGSQADLTQTLAGAEVAWVPSRTAGGIHVALEAMALGRPVIGSRLPGLAEIIADGDTGYLVTPGDKIELARQTRWLLDDAGLRRRLGEAGRQRAWARFAAEDFIRRIADLYAGARRKMAG